MSEAQEVVQEVVQEAQPATPEQQARAAFDAAVRAAQEKAIQEVQQNAQIEIQMRSIALGEAVRAKKEGIGAGAITESAEVFLKFLKTGESVQKEQ
jgi:hypothetical protein